MLGKKCMAREVLELTLFLTMLYGTTRFLDLDDEGSDGSREFIDQGLPDVRLGNGTLGSSISAPHHHLRSNWTPHLGNKELEEPPGHWNTLDEHAYYRDRVLEELGRLSVLRYSQQPTTVPKDTLQNVTAYILDETQAVTAPPAQLPTTFQSLTPTNNVEGGLEEDQLHSFLLEEMETISLTFKDELALNEERREDDDVAFLEDLGLHLLNDTLDALPEESQESYSQLPILEDVFGEEKTEAEEMLDQLNLSLLNNYYQQNNYDADELSGDEMLSAISPFALHAFDTEEHGKEKEESEDQFSSLPTTFPDELWESDSGIFDSCLDSPGETTDEESGRGGRGRRASPTHQNNSNPNQELGIVDGDICEIDDWSEMLQTAPHPTRPTPHIQHPRAFQVNGLVSGMRGVSGSEGKYQDIGGVNFMNGSDGGIPHHHFSPAYLPHPFHPHQGQGYYPPLTHTLPSMTFNPDSTRGPLLHNATLPQLNLSTQPYSTVELGGPLNSSGGSMHLSSEHAEEGSHYKLMDNPQDSLYFQGSSGEVGNQTNEGMMGSLINTDEAMQLMDLMAMNDGMYAMRVIESPLGHQASHHPTHLPTPTQGGAYGGGVRGEERLEASSDSAVSSMGSERVPPLIEPILGDNDWSQHQPSPFSIHYGAEKLRGYDYFSKGDSRQRVLVPVAQKKHHMFGKRLVQESHLPLTQPYAPPECGIGSGNVDVGSLNHSYALPPTHPDHPSMTARTQRAQPPKDKTHKKEQLSRDEKKANLLALPLTTDEIVNLPMDEFNERLSKHDLTESQLSLIRDIRRRGKNKVAAQNCRKRKIDQITQLEKEVSVIRSKKESLLRENDQLLSRRNALSDKYAFLYRHVFQNLRNVDGNAYNISEWGLVEGGDGNVRLMRLQHSNFTSNDPVQDSTSLRRPSRLQGKPKEETKRPGRE